MIIRVSRTRVIGLDINLYQHTYTTLEMETIATTLTRIIHRTESQFPSLTQRFRLTRTPMIQLALNVEDSSASTLHVDLHGAPGLSQESRLQIESRPKYTSTCSSVLTKQTQNRYGTIRFVTFAYSTYSGYFCFTNCSSQIIRNSAPSSNSIPNASLTKDQCTSIEAHPMRHAAV